MRTDLENFFSEIAPEDPARYVHNDEGPDDMPAHLRTALTGVNLAVPIIHGALALGTWQGCIFSSIVAGRTGARSRCMRSGSKRSDEAIQS